VETVYWRWFVSEGLEKRGRRVSEPNRTTRRKMMMMVSGDIVQFPFFKR
jgi:hypothetical protein